MQHSTPRSRPRGAALALLAVMAVLANTALAQSATHMTSSDLYHFCTTDSLKAACAAYVDGATSGFLVAIYRTSTALGFEPQPPCWAVAGGDTKLGISDFVEFMKKKPAPSNDKSNAAQTMITAFEEKHCK